MQQLRQAVLRHVRIPLQQTSSNPAAAAVSSFWRGFAGGGYLDKDEVTQRVLHVTKHFEKIDPAKVRAAAGRQICRGARGGAARGAPVGGARRRCPAAAPPLRAFGPARVRSRGGRAGPSAAAAWCGGGASAPAPALAATQCSAGISALGRRPQRAPAAGAPGARSVAPAAAAPAPDPAQARRTTACTALTPGRGRACGGRACGGRAPRAPHRCPPFPAPAPPTSGRHRPKP
jgi:hypothetical protein